jgi:hypothetical protein
MTAAHPDPVPAGMRIGLVARILAGLTTAAAIHALVLQLDIMGQTMTPGAALWRFAGYFTLLTNLLVCLVAGHLALGRADRMGAPPVRLMATVGIALVGLVYWLALQDLWQPTGAQFVADMLLHRATPVLMVLTWLAAPHGGLEWRALAWPMGWALAYAAYALLRGAFDGWYAYWFLDPTQQGAGALALSVTVLAAAFAVFAALLIALDRWLARRAAR